MGIAVIITMLLAICSLKINFNNNQIHEDYMSIDHTNAIKGIFVVFIILAHFQQYVPETWAVIDYPYIFVREYIGQLIVTPFMFVSGYGILRAYERKGNGYIQQIPKHRFFKTLIHFDIGVCIFLVANMILQQHHSPVEYVTALIGWNPVGNSNWYIFAILWLYIITWLGGLITQVIWKKPNKMLFAIAITIGVLIYIAGISIFKEKVFYNTVICYPFGMWFALCEDKVKKSSRLLHLWLLELMVLGGVFIVVYLVSPIYSIRSALFPLIIFIITMRFCVNSKTLVWLGEHTFSIYMLQRLPMMIFAYFRLQDISVNLYLGLVLASTLLIAWCFDLVMNKLDSTLRL